MRISKVRWAAEISWVDSALGDSVQIGDFKI